MSQKTDLRIRLEKITAAYVPDEEALAHVEQLAFANNAVVLGYLAPRLQQYSVVVERMRSHVEEFSQKALKKELLGSFMVMECAQATLRPEEYDVISALSGALPVAEGWKKLWRDSTVEYLKALRSRSNIAIFRVYLSARQQERFATDATGLLSRMHPSQGVTSQVAMSYFLAPKQL